MMNRRYNIINNSLGWLCVLIAGVSYLLTIEPTASFLSLIHISEPTRQYS